MTQQRFPHHRPNARGIHRLWPVRVTLTKDQQFGILIFFSLEQGGGKKSNDHPIETPWRSCDQWRPCHEWEEADTQIGALNFHNKSPNCHGVNHRNPESAIWPHWNHHDVNFAVTPGTTGCHHDHSGMFKTIVLHLATPHNIMGVDLGIREFHNKTCHIQWFHKKTWHTIWQAVICGTRYIFYRNHHFDLIKSSLREGFDDIGSKQLRQQINQFLLLQISICDTDHMTVFDFFYIWYLCHMIPK